MTVAANALGGAVPPCSSASSSGLDGVNFFVAAMAAGFGPYVAAYLADQKWTPQEVGFVLSVSALAALLSQLPGGELVDTVRSKRLLVAFGAIIVATSAIIIGVSPSVPVVSAGLILQGITGGFLGPALASISLGIVGHSGLPDRLGRNQRFASIGGLVAAGLMGLAAYFLSYRAIFAFVAVLVFPLFVMLARIRPSEIHFGRACGAPGHHTIDQPSRIQRKALWKNPVLLTFAVGLFLFQLANASILPLVGETLAYQRDRRSSLIVSALIILPQIVVAVAAPWVGRQAQSWGRRPLLLIGFTALLVRAVLLAFVANPLFLMGFQLLDGVSGAVVGVLTALVISDVTNGTGRFNLAQGSVGTASGIGASLSTALFGLVAAHFGRTVVFLSIAAVALLAVLLFLFFMPETKPAVDRWTAPARSMRAR
jgi:MFS family permease